MPRKCRLERQVPPFGLQIKPQQQLKHDDSVLGLPTPLQIAESTDLVTAKSEREAA